MVNAAVFFFFFFSDWARRSPKQNPPGWSALKRRSATQRSPALSCALVKLPYCHAKLICPRAVSSEPLPKRNSGGMWVPALHAASLSFSGNHRGPYIHGYLYDPIHFLHQPRRHNIMKHVGSRSKHMTQHPTASTFP